MKIEISYKCVSGTDPGGEEVSLNVVATSRRHPTREDVESAMNECLRGIPAKTGDADGSSLDDLNGVYLVDGFVRTVESEHGFYVMHTAEKVRNDVLAAHADALDPSKPDSVPAWTQSLRTGSYRLEFDLYAHGNAD